MNNPIIGIGFGIPSSSENYIFATYVAGIPVSLPAEKGMILTATLEEIGIIGFVFVFIIGV